jgi:TRAP-type C4-dicarboxylate transport system permease small subunit
MLDDESELAMARCGKKRLGGLTQTSSQCVENSATHVPSTASAFSLTLSLVSETSASSPPIVHARPTDDAPKESVVLDPVDRFANDSPLARGLRMIDRFLGVAEQAVLVGLLFVIVLIAAATVVTHISWADEAIRYGVFTMAMIGGAYATHHQRLLSMDIVSRKLPPRGRAWLRVGLAFFTLAMTIVLFRGGLQILALQQAVHQTGKISTVAPAMFIPIGMALIATHLLLQALIELDYLRRSQTAPEPEQGAV